MANIIYAKVFETPETYNVFLDGRITGRIHAIGSKYQYRPKGSRTGGDLYDTLAACKASLEDDPQEA